MSRIGKNKIHQAAMGVELNIMPFIDIFSLLCTFLLFSAVFVAIGIHVVQVPFFSNAAPSKSDKEEEKILSVKVEINSSSVDLVTSIPGSAEEKKTFMRNQSGVADLHKELVQVRMANEKTDKVTLYIDEGINFSEIVEVMDAISLREQNDPVVGSGGMLFPKIVFGSVIL